MFASKSELSCLSTSRLWVFGLGCRQVFHRHGAGILDSCSCFSLLNNGGSREVQEGTLLWAQIFSCIVQNNRNVRTSRCLDFLGFLYACVHRHILIFFSWACSRRTIMYKHRLTENATSAIRFGPFLSSWSAWPIRSAHLQPLLLNPISSRRHTVCVSFSCCTELQCREVHGYSIMLIPGTTRNSEGLPDT